MISGPISDPRLSEFVRETIERWKVPGLSLAVLRNGRVECSGFGVASVETGQPVSPDTLFQSGSISKVFTSTAIMRLVDRGVLDLSAPVRLYVSDLSLANEHARRSITLRHLLTHTSGIEGDRFDRDYGQNDDALARTVGDFRTLRQITSPGEYWSYCNSGFYLAGRVIERTLSERYERAMRTEIFEPLRLRRSCFAAHQAITHPIATGHSYDDRDNPVVERRFGVLRAVNPAGGLITTAGELARFAAMHINLGTFEGTRILTEDSVRSMQQPVVKASGFADFYGLGWGLVYRNGTTLVRHGGTTSGFQSALTLAPECGTAIVTLTNSSRGKLVISEIENWILEYYLGIPRVEPPRRDVTEADLERLTGRYRQRHQEIEVSREGRELRISLRWENPREGTAGTVPPQSLIPVGRDGFVLASGSDRGERVDFIFESRAAPRFVRFRGRLAERVLEEANREQKG